MNAIHRKIDGKIDLSIRRVNTFFPGATGTCQDRPFTSLHANGAVRQFDRYPGGRASLKCKGPFASRFAFNLS